jgi:CRP-like cAMP-binding protein
MKFSNSEIQDLLLKFYPNLPKNEREIFLSISKYKVIKNKETVHKCGGTAKNLMLILKGAARSYSINNEGEELNDHLRAEGHLIGDARIFGDGPQILNVEAIGEVHVLIVDMSKLESLGFDNPILMNFYLDFMKEMILTLSHRVHTFVSMNSTERYKDLIRWNPLYLKSTFDKHIATFLGIKPLTLYRIKKES